VIEAQSGGRTAEETDCPLASSQYQRSLYLTVDSGPQQELRKTPDTVEKHGKHGVERFHPVVL
jgi:hypothetical protein